MDAEPLTVQQMFMLDEYRALRKEIEFYIAEFRLQERNVVIAIGVIWAWLIKTGEWHPLPWFLPVILTLAATTRSYILNQHMRVISKYIEGIEKAFHLAGWEHFFTQEVRNRVRSNIANVALTYALLILSVVTFLFRRELLQ